MDIELKALFWGFKFKGFAVQRKSQWVVGFSESKFHMALSKQPQEARSALCLALSAGFILLHAGWRSEK